MENIRDYKCLSCGAGLRFEPNLQKWKCDYCRSIFEKIQLDEFYSQKEARERERAAAKGKTATIDGSVAEMDAYHCKNCGAEIVSDPETIATFCLYCKSPTIIRARMQGEFNPRYVIPFKIDQKQAKELYRNWIKGHFLAPKIFKENEEIEKIRGVYAPFWLYHSEHVRVYSSGVGEHQRTWRSGDTEYTETSYYNVVREGEISYHNIPVDASVKMDDTAMMAIEPFDYAEMKDFSMDYMTGFFAERFDEDKSLLENRAKGRMDEYAKEKIRSTIQYSRYTPNAEDIKYQNIDADYSLLPVYILTNIYQGKANQYIVNGQTGKIYGKVPISKAKLAATWGGTFVVVWILMGLWGAFFG